MAPFSAYIENTLGTLFSGIKQHDAKLLSRTSPALTAIKPTVTIQSSELGSTSPGQFTATKHELLGENLFPDLSWTLPSDVDATSIRSWLLVIEDADAPLPSPIVHGLYHAIPAATRSLSSEDFVETDGKPNFVQGQFRFGANRRGTVWTGPRPVLGHGNHRYFFQLVGLNVDPLWMPDAKLTKEALLDESQGLIKGKVVCWGEYIGNFERKL